MSLSTRSHRTVFSHIDPGPEPSFEEYSPDTDIEMTGVEEAGDEVESEDIMEHDPVSNVNEDRIIIAIDFGTTFSSVAYTVLPKGVRPEQLTLQDVQCISNYPHYRPTAGMLAFRQDVPTELWYERSFEERVVQHSTNGPDTFQNSEDESDSSSGSDESEVETDQSHFEDDIGLGRNVNSQDQHTYKVPATQHWGYGVQHRLNMKNISRDEARPLIRFKLNLDHATTTEAVRTDIRTTLNVLKKEQIIKKDTDIYTHYLIHLLNHTKEQLILSNNLRQDMLIQFVLCVPAKWPMKACRIMQIALEEAVQEVNLSVRDSSSVHNLFMISEPEAAAESILAEERKEIFPGETVIIVDAGGGTVDAVTYQCKNEHPLRLSKEVVAPDSKLCGASYINERLQKKLSEKLASETYLFNNTVTLDSIVQSSVDLFENYQKRLIDVTKRDAAIAPIQINYLRENPQKDFRENFLELRRKSVKKLFEKSLEGVKEVLESQLELSESTNHCVSKIILTGGFGQSPSLQSYLRTHLKKRRNINNHEIDLVVSLNPSTAVAKGGVLRALNKRFGPSRITQCSYGLSISEPYSPDEIEAHSQTKPRINKADGERYVNETIRWVIHAEQRVNNMQPFTFNLRHTFPLTRKQLICAETLWMSDRIHESHYRKTHAKNKGAMMIGHIEADLTELREKGEIMPVQPSVDSVHHGSKTTYWEIQYEVAMIIDGRSIRFEARWPAKRDLKQGQSQKVLAMKLVGIASSFKLGTA